ncbi:hypothetical protein HAX54_000720 [Datura stramonium]|uniref:Uncharacterized protein n=1 Tax=Datura stramonium TaxID=4076 RepID=A0ABS8WQ72_DATST|nr:hypothetical protein [Datura stramonium]
MMSSRKHIVVKPFPPERPRIRGALRRQVERKVEESNKMKQISKKGVAKEFTTKLAVQAHKSKRHQFLLKQEMRQLLHLWIRRFNTQQDKKASEEIVPFRTYKARWQVELELNKEFTKKRNQNGSENS